MFWGGAVQGPTATALRAWARYEIDAALLWLSRCLHVPWEGNALSLYMRTCNRHASLEALGSTHRAANAVMGARVASGFMYGRRFRVARGLVS